MKTTIGEAIRDVAGADVERWANEDAIPVLKTMRKVLNFRSTERVGRETDSTAPAVIWTSAQMPPSSAWYVKAVVMGIGSAEHAFYELRARFRSIAGVVTQIGATVIVASDESLPGYDAAFAVVGRTVTLSVTSATPPTIWSAVIETHEVIL